MDKITSDIFIEVKNLETLLMKAHRSIQYGFEMFTKEQMLEVKNGFERHLSIYCRMSTADTDLVITQRTEERFGIGRYV